LEGAPGNINPHKMRSVFETLETTVDRIIVDGPPFFMADAITLAPLVDAVIIVILPGRSREDTVRTMVEQLQLVNAPILGVVFNRVSQKAAVTFGGYRVYSPRYARDEKYKKAMDEQEGEATETMRWTGSPPGNIGK